MSETEHESGLPMDAVVTVCASCLHASCWQGEFYCQDYRTADITTRTVRELLSLRETDGIREHPSWWRRSLAAPLPTEDPEQ